MLFSILECLTYILAVYGLLILVIGAADLIRCRIRGHRPKVRVVLLVQDAEDQIEYIVRNAVKKEFTAKVFSDEKLAVVDMHSKDNTYLLLQKLQKNFQSVEVLKSDDIDEVIKEYRS